MEGNQYTGVKPTRFLFWLLIFKNLWTPFDWPKTVQKK